MSKISKDKYWMGLAEAASVRSPDAETKVGAVLVKNDTGGVVATGYNGFLRFAPDKDLPCTRPDKYKYIIHAEENLIAHCSKTGTSSDNCTLVITLSPCQKCLRLLWQAGITRVLCKDIYRDHDTNLADIKIVEQKTSDGYTLLTYERKL